MNMPMMSGLAFLETYAQWPAAQRPRTVIFMLATSLYERYLTRAQALTIVGFLDNLLTFKNLQALSQQHFPAA